MDIEASPSSAGKRCFTAVNTEVAFFFSALSTVRWGRGKEECSKKGHVDAVGTSPLPAPRVCTWPLGRSLPDVGSQWAIGTFPLKNHSPQLQGRKCWFVAVLRRSVSHRRDIPSEGTPSQRLRWWWRRRSGTSSGEVPQLFPANCFTQMLEKDMALSFRNHSSVQWVTAGSKHLWNSDRSSSQPFLKALFVCIRGNRPQAYLIQFFAPYRYKTLQLCIKVQVALVHWNYAETTGANPIKVAFFSLCVYKQHLFGCWLLGLIIIIFCLFAFFFFFF